MERPEVQSGGRNGDDNDGGGTNLYRCHTHTHTRKLHTGHISGMKTTLFTQKHNM